MLINKCFHQPRLFFYTTRNLNCKRTGTYFGKDCFAMDVTLLNIEGPSLESGTTPLHFTLILSLLFFAMCKTLIIWIESNFIWPYISFFVLKACPAKNDLTWSTPYEHGTLLFNFLNILLLVFLKSNTFKLIIIKHL